MTADADTGCDVAPPVHTEPTGTLASVESVTVAVIPVQTRLTPISDFTLVMSLTTRGATGSGLLKLTVTFSVEPRSSLTAG